MSTIKNKQQVQKMQVAYISAWENILSVKPQWELTQAGALEENYMRRFFAHIELYGVERCDIEAPHFVITAAQLGIVNTFSGWDRFLNGQSPVGSLL